jgi:glycolate oxidase FAD binding subunit
MSDCTKDIVAQVAQALARRTSLSICAGNSKAHILGRHINTANSAKLDLSKHSGIIDYHPTELVLTARAGTTLTEIQTTLAKEGQTLSFEPPDFGNRATLGGTLACNLSGPARPWSGSIRDMILGVQLINGKAELLNFGGQVMKNVAGYDVSRLQAGALGTLGVLTKISLKVLPVPEHTVTLSYQMDAQTAVDLMNARARQPKPLSGACWSGGILYLRLSGAENAVIQTAKLWGGDQLPESEYLWRQLREFDHPFFTTEEPLWRFSHGPTAAVQQQFGDMLIDWGGAQRWLLGQHDQTALEQSAEKAGGHVSLFRGGDRSGEVKHRLSPLQQNLHKQLKVAFDPDGILNPGRLYSWM